ncbi:hypothetical protein Pelo_19852 [Pelomyxa schiedti]|nr:hypothetical protein Pelo_19852 [Pelomyxa schiedti]
MQRLALTCKALYNFICTQPYCDKLWAHLCLSDFGIIPTVTATETGTTTGRGKAIVAFDLAPRYTRARCSYACRQSNGGYLGAGQMYQPERVILTVKHVKSLRKH